MAFTIKDPETCRLIKELAELTGESMAQATAEAVRERLNRVAPHHKPRLAERLVQIGKSCAEHLKEPYRSIDHGQLLYEDNGRCDD